MTRTVEPNSPPFSFIFIVEDHICFLDEKCGASTAEEVGGSPIELKKFSLPDQTAAQQQIVSYSGNGKSAVAYTTRREQCFALCPSTVSIELAGEVVSVLRRQEQHE